MMAVLEWIGEALLGIGLESWHLFAEMAPYLIIGFIFAGILHVFISVQRISRHLGKGNFFSVLKATLFGIPLPLCSCSVIPAVSTLRKSGASRGATLAFLISTPTSGVDSILATYSLLGPIFTGYRVLASFLAGVVSGVSANLFDRTPDPETSADKSNSCVVCGEDATADGHSHSFGARMRTMIAYSFGELVADIGKWVLIGTIIGGVISYFVPADLISTYLASPILQMLIMLVISIPLYICATGSLPIAAALILKGISPGAALVFLIAGPATNAVTITVVSKKLGRRSLIIYLVSIALVSISMGLLFDLLIPASLAVPSNGKIIGMLELPDLVKWISAGLVLALILYQFGKAIFTKRPKHNHASNDAPNDSSTDSSVVDFADSDSCGCGSKACSISENED